MKVLLVETDHVVRDRIKVAFQQFEGTAVDCAEDDWALELAKGNAYDMLVIDDTLRAPEDGLKLLQDLRAGGLDGPVILLSKAGAEGTAKDRAGVDASTVLAVPPDTLDVFKAILAAQARMASPQAR